MINMSNRHQHTQTAATLKEIYFGMTKQERAEPCNCGAHPTGEIVPLATGEVREVDPLASVAFFKMCACCAKSIYYRVLETDSLLGR